jgi:hypothetical protein
MPAGRGENEEVGWLRAQLARVTAERDQLQQHLDARREFDALLMTSAPAADGTGPLPAVPAQRPRSHRSRATHLRLVKVLIPGAIIGALKCAWHAHPVATAAATTAAFTVAGTTAAVVVAPHGIVAQALGAAPVASAPSDGLYSVVPVGGSSSPSPSSLRLIGALTRPGLDARSASGLPPVTYAPGPVYQPPVSSQSSPSSPSSQQSQQAQPAGGPAVLNVAVDAIDLSSGTPQQVTISATGSGWVSWRVKTDGSDLDFSPSSGVLKAGDTVTVTVSMDAAANPADVSETFSIGNQSVAATLQAPAPVPAVTPADTPVAPTDLPAAVSS